MAGTVAHQAPAVGSSELVALLQCPHTYSHTAQVECRETHISWLFLTDQFVYKLKKPVKFDFLDFSTAQQRQLACQQEVELNRRLAPNVYLGVLPIVKTTQGCLALDLPGTPVDWVVKMHRLPAASALDARYAAGCLDRRTVDAVASRLVQFYGQSPPVLLAVTDYLDRLERHVAGNHESLQDPSHDFDDEQVARLHAGQLRLLRLAPDLLADRVVQGRIVEGHGDLRPEHVYLTSPPVIIDCLEFNVGLRTLDVVDELAFLLMECEAMGARWIGEQILDRYLRASGDAPSDLVVAFYCAYRACVRAKVAALRAAQVAVEQRPPALQTAQRYLDLADRYVGQLGPPVIVIVRGISGSGKSTLADRISRQMGWSHLQTDRLRRDLLGSERDTAAYDQGRYSPENRTRIYREMQGRAEQLVAAGSSVVLDGTYSTQESLLEVDALARRLGAELLSVDCQCTPEVAAERIGARLQQPDNLSAARPDFPARQHQSQQAAPADLTTISVDTTSDTVEPLGAILAELRRCCFGDAAAG